MKPKAIVAASLGVREARNTTADDISPYQGPSYPSAYIRVVEGWASQPDSEEVIQLLQKYSLENPECPVMVDQRNREERGGREGRKQDKSAAGEGYEVAMPQHRDRAFLKFQKELAVCPQQILRCVVFTLRCVCVYAHHY